MENKAEDIMPLYKILSLNTPAKCIPTRKILHTDPLLFKICAEELEEMEKWKRCRERKTHGAVSI